MSKKRTILILDDNEKNRAIFETYLEMNGFSVCFAENNLHASRIIKTQIPDVVMVNIVSPATDTLQDRNTISSLPELKDIPAIVLAPRSTPRNVLSMLRGQAVDVFVKPFDADELLAKIQELIHRRENQKVIKLNPHKTSPRPNSLQIRFSMQPNKSPVFQKTIPWERIDPSIEESG